MRSSRRVESLGLVLRVVVVFYTLWLVMKALAVIIATSAVKR